MRNISSVTNRRYRLLDAFRGIAILWVVVFHLLIDASEHYGLILDSIIKNGFLGVSIFFVISGYGVAASIQAHYQRPHMFLMRRFKRIYPCYWWSLLFSTLIIPILHAMLLMPKSQSFSLSWPYTFIDWIQVLTLTKVFSASSWALNKAFDPYNGPIWFLAIIVQIYVIVTAFLYCIKHIHVLFFICYVMSLLTYVPAIHHMLPYGVFIPYFAQFYIGFAIFYLLEKDIDCQRKWLITSIIIIPIMPVFLYAPRDSQYLALSCATTTGFLLIILHRYDYMLERSFSIRMLYLFGAFSYSLYLLHFPFRIIGGMIAKNVFPFLGDSTRPLVTTAVAIILSFIWYLFFEKPEDQIRVIKGLLSPIDTIASGWNSVYSNYFKATTVHDRAGRKL